MINLKVCDPQGSGKGRNFFFSFLCLGKAVVLVDAWVIFALESYALSICCFVNIVFLLGRGMIVPCERHKISGYCTDLES